MIALKIAWSGAWLAMLGAFAFVYWRIDRERRKAFETRMRRWGDWTPWRDKRIAEEFTV